MTIYPSLNKSPKKNLHNIVDTTKVLLMHLLAHPLISKQKMSLRSIHQRISPKTYTFGFVLCLTECHIFLLFFFQAFLFVHLLQLCFYNLKFLLLVLLWLDDFQMSKAFEIAVSRPAWLYQSRVG